MYKKGTLFSLFFAILLFALFSFGFGCSRSGTAVLPGPQVYPSGQNMTAVNNTILWGLWDVSIDPGSGSAGMIPLRGAEFTANITRFMQPPIADHNMLGIEVNPETDISTGYVDIVVIVTHPFTGLDMFTGFDVRGVVIGDGSISGLVDPNILYAGAGDLRLLNADGLTRWFNPVEFTTYGKLFGYTMGMLGNPSYDFTATLNGYKYFCNGLDEDTNFVDFFSDTTCPNSRGVFASTSTLRRNYQLQFPMIGGYPDLRFQYAIIASWELPDQIPPTSIPDDFPISANCREAFCISADDQSNMFYQDPENNGGYLRLEVRVFNHQGTENPDGVSGEVGAINLETSDGLIPGNFFIFDSALLADALIAEDPVSATYFLEVADVTPSGLGNFSVLVGVENTETYTYHQGFPGFDTPEGQLTSYILTSAAVNSEIQPEPPVAIAEIISPEPYCVDSPIEFDASTSYDPDGGSIVSYEWDFDGDGFYGDSYDSGTDANPSKIFTEPGLHNIDLRVTDDDTDTDTLDEPIAIIIESSEVWVDDDNVSGPWDGSFEHPWLTIQEGIDNVSPDCGSGHGQVWVLDGTYAENYSMKDDITVEGVGDPAPLIATPLLSDYPIATFENANRSTIRHFRAQPRCYTFGIDMMDTLDNTLDDIEFLDNPGGDTCVYAVYGVSISNTNLTLNNIRTDGYMRPVCGYLRVSGGGITITNCVLLNIEYTMPCPMGIIQISQSGDPNLVAKNVIGYATMVEAYAVHEVKVVGFQYMNGDPGSVFRNNLIFNAVSGIYDKNTWGLYINNGYGMTVEHNTIVGISGDGWTYGIDITDPEVDPSGTNFRSNIVADLTGNPAGSSSAYHGTWASSLAIDYSCDWNSGDPTSGDIIEGTGLVHDDPEFMDPDNNDYRVADGSPCDGTAHDGTDMGAYGGSDPLTWLPE